MDAESSAKGLVVNIRMASDAGACPGYPSGR
jgi:hypothetical protein